MNTPSFFEGTSVDISIAARQRMKKYDKYYSLMDDTDVYYTASILDPRVKGDLITAEVEDKEVGVGIVQSTRENLHKAYDTPAEPHSQVDSRPSTSSASGGSLQSRVFRRLLPVEASRPVGLVSDIDRYFESSRVGTVEPDNPAWPLEWWRQNRHDFPRMAAAARDFLAIAASEVAVVRLFNAGRDMLGVRRHSMTPETMRMLVLLGRNMQ